MKINSAEMTNPYSVKAQKKNMGIKRAAATETIQEQTTDRRVIDYYHQLAKEFPDIAFKMSDYKAAFTTPKGEPVIGYKGNSYQTSDAFSMPGKCSMEIDFDVLKKMTEDAAFEEEIKAEISLAQRSYKMYDQWAEQDGYEYHYQFIHFEGGELVRGTVESHWATTDAEKRKIHQQSSADDSRVIKDNPAVKTSASSEEVFMEMLDDAHRKQKLRNKERREEEMQDNLWKKKVAEKSYM